MDKEKFDNVSISCPRLGHSLSFGYCRGEREGNPCNRIKACWGAFLPLEEWLAEHFIKEEIKYMDQPPVSKLASIIELIAKSKKG